MPKYAVSGRIRAELQAQPGKALCVWRDAGWGNLVWQGKYRDGRFADELVTARVELMREWEPDPAPAWVTCVPSRRHPELVSDFARRLAVAIGLPFAPVLSQNADRAEQKAMVNSAHQARNLDGSLSVFQGELLPGAVLLVDDMVDSGWTFTVCAWLLRSNGSGEVWPLALADSGTGDE